MDSFVAIDFETATRNRNSACSIGVAVVDGGKIIDTYSSLIRPPDLAFDADLVGIHGITAEVVHNAPTFSDVLPNIEQLCRCGTVIAHNAPFDIGVLLACEANSDHHWLPQRYLCTVQVARSVLPGLPNHKLGTLANLFGLVLEHHNAASDACACAEIGIRLFRLAGKDLVNQYCRDIDEFGRRHEYAACYDEATIHLALSRGDCSDGKADTAAFVEFDKVDGRFEGLRFVFTGVLAYIDRPAAMAIVEEQGGRATTTVSKKTDIVVVGDEVLGAFRCSGKTTGKLAKAVTLRDQGVPIRIIGETEFLALISTKSTGVDGK